MKMNVRSAGPRATHTIRLRAADADLRRRAGNAILDAGIPGGRVWWAGKARRHPLRWKDVTLMVAGAGIARRVMDALTDEGVGADGPRELA